MNLPPVKKVAVRRLKLPDPRIINKYNKRLKQYFRRFSLSDQIDLLQERVSFPLTEEVTEEY